MKEGFLIIDKPSGITSHDVVNFMRRKFRMRRIGHAGTLDPLATGVLVILLGKATKLFNEFSAFDKAYEATLRLGLKTTTADINGQTIKESDCTQIIQEEVQKAFERLTGTIQQIPPMVSAVKFKGKRLYQLARSGIEIAREPRTVTIKELRLVDFNLPDVRLFVRCSKGTYIRTIAEDVGEALGCGGCISQIKRTQVGSFLIDEAVSLEDVNESYIRHWKR
ncbi:MAG: tRNA pseudouridine(55) synthase TruB [Candidatus Omnitrophota bacterium]